MFYNELECSGCNLPMHDDDDIVVCPVCGTPQHRECYNKNNCCVNEHLHASGFVWKAPEKPEEPEEPETEKNDNLVESKEIEENSTDAQAQPKSIISQIGIDTPEAETLMMRGVNANQDDEFDGVKVGEAAIYIQSNTRRFINKYMKMKDKKHQISWNWAAFFFSPHWFFYRKLYKVGFIFLGIVIALNVALVSQSNIINDAYDKLVTTVNDYNAAYSDLEKNDTEENRAKVESTYQEGMAIYSSVYKPLLIIFTCTFLIPNTVAALIANGLYKKKMLMDINMAHRGSDDAKIARLSIIRNGGVSFFAAMGSIIVGTYLPSLLISLAEKF